MQRQRSAAKTPQPPEALGNGRKGKPDFYPSSDGKPMAETAVHIAELIRSFLTLEGAFAADPRILVAADMFVYYEKGYPAAVVAPDLFVVKGVAKGHRDHFKVWLEGAVPSFVLELTSASTAVEDLRKRDVYARIGVPEYVLYDPRPTEQRPRRAGRGVLAGYRQEAGGSEPIPLEADGGLVSRELGLRLLDPRERAAREAEARRDAERRAAADAERAAAAEARLAELEDLLRQRGIEQ